MDKELTSKLLDLGKGIVKAISDNLVIDLKKTSDGLDLNASVDKTKVKVTKKGDEPATFDISHGNNKSDEDQEKE